MVSDDYRIAWQVTASGDTLMSANHTLMSTVAQATPVGVTMSDQYTLAAGFQAPPDADDDGLRNFVDNCLASANADQRDSDADGFGNVCDGDLNNDGIINVVDLGLLRSVFFSNDPDADFNGDGVVNVIDLGALRAAFFQAPGPSGIN